MFCGSWWIKAVPKIKCIFQHWAAWMTNMWGRVKNASYGYWCDRSGQFFLGCVMTHSRHWCAGHCCRTWLKPELKYKFLVNDCLLVFWYYNWDFNNSERRMKEVGVWFLWEATAQAYMIPGVRGTEKPLLLTWPFLASDPGVSLKGQEQCVHLSRSQQVHGPGKILFKEATKISFH